MNPIGWCDETVNPRQGCRFGCPFCFARIQAKRRKQACKLCYEFKPHAHLERLAKITPRQKPRRIFLDSMWDWNTPGVSLQELWPIVEKTRECPQHTFQILSKYPKGYVRFDFPPNVWLGTSISRTGEFYRVQQLRQAANGNLCFVSIEPIMEAIQHNFTREEIDWVIVGQETGHRKEKILARKKWIDALIANARAESVPIYIKDSIVDALGASYKIEEFPNRL